MNKIIRGIWAALFWLNIFYSTSRNGCQKAVNNRKRRAQKQHHAWTEKLTYLPPSVFLHLCMKITDTQAAVTCLQPVFIYNKVGAATQLYDINIIILMGNIILSPTMQSKLSPCLGSSSALFSVWGLL